MDFNPLVYNIIFSAARFSASVYSAITQHAAILPKLFILAIDAPAISAPTLSKYIYQSHQESICEVWNKKQAQGWGGF
jgi:molybdopterin-guanine dinucleotide biosynthesis protein A